MGVSLTYRPCTTVSPAVAAVIAEEARRVASGREWWSEPLHFAKGSTLAGSTKIFLPGYSLEGGGYQSVALDDDLLMASYDAVAILTILTDWAQRFGLSWSIGFDGDEIGEVSAAGADAELLAMIASVVTGGESNALPAFDESRIEEIRRRHANRLPDAPVARVEMHFVGKTVRDADFSGREFTTPFADAALETSRFDAARFQTCTFHKAKVNDCSFNGARFEACDLTAVVAQDSRFVGASFRESRSMSMSFVRGRFTGCDFSNAVFAGAELRAAKFIDCNFDGARFDGCDLRGTKFEGGAPLEGQFVKCIGR